MTIQSSSPASVGIERPLFDEELVARASKLVPLIREHASEGSANGQISPVVIDALEAEGLLNLLVPRRLGGQEASMRTVVEVLAEISRGDGSTGWVASLLNAGTWFGTTFTEQAQNDLFAGSPNTRISAIFTPGSSMRRVEGGYIVSGRWPYSSGAFAANWAALGIALDVPEGEDPRAIALFSRDQYTIEESWYVTGMKGTASNTVVMDEQFVPDHRVQSFAGMRDAQYLTPYADQERNSRMTFIAVAALVLISPQLGLARHALELTLQKLPEKGVAYTRYTQAKNSPVHQLGVAQAATKVRLAELLAGNAADLIDKFAFEGKLQDIETRAQIRNDIGVIADLAKEAIDSLLTANGAGSFAEPNVLSRIWRDSEIGARHAYVTPEVGKELYGRVLLGADDPITMDV
ncbi:acyl-CoA dehydrogenase family protein [Pseudarthrobacter sp. LMD1-1-1.1]|uniref:acyl-CoA dehydrogenase family protein n=1 Tax=Pseudarthrobacter sp. LMD1-1-1.1 TaxID=3135242 RepID=UPI0034428B37